MPPRDPNERDTNELVAEALHRVSAARGEETDPGVRVAIDRRMIPLRRISLATLWTVGAGIVGFVSWAVVTGNYAREARELTLEHADRITALEIEVKNLQHFLKMTLEPRKEGRK